MSSQEDINAESPIEAKDIFQPKQETPKIIRVLTVIAYALSVSMAAILLSIYYIFIWQGRPHIGAQTAIGFYENDNITSDYIIKPEELPPVFSIKNDFLESKNEIDLSLNDTEELTNSSGAEVRKLENRTHSPKDMRQQMTSNEVNPEEATTMLPSVTSTPEEAEENATWPVYYYDQKRKRSIFIKKIMNFKHSYNEFTK